MRGLVTTMQSSFRSFGFGLLLSILLVYLVLVAQFSSFIDPFLIVLAVPTGLVGVMLTLAFTDTTLNIQSLMGIVMLTGMVVSNSILIVDFANRLRAEGRGVREAVAHACRIRLRPILMTSLATVVGLLPMALKLETGSEAYAPLARVIIGGLLASVVLTIFVVPAAYLLIYQRGEAAAPHRSDGGNSMRMVTSSICRSCCVRRTDAVQWLAAQDRLRILRLQQAEQIALQNHPQIQAAANLAFGARRR